MSTPVTPEINASDSGQPALSEIDRLKNAIAAPTKTFTDIKRNASWWAPFLIMAVLSTVFVWVVGQKITWDQVVENQFSAMSDKQKDRIAQLTPDQQAQQRKGMLMGFKYFSYVAPVFVIIIVVIVAAINMATMNFGFGAEIPFKQALAVSWYAGMPRMFQSILAIGITYINKDPSTFNMQNPVVTNLSFLTSQSLHPALYSALSFVDVFMLWATYLTGIGLATVASKKESTGLTVAFGWYIVFMLVSVGFKFLTS